MFEMKTLNSKTIETRKLDYIGKQVYEIIATFKDEETADKQLDKMRKMNENSIIFMQFDRCVSIVKVLDTNEIVYVIRYKNNIN